MIAVHLALFAISFIDFTHRSFKTSRPVQFALAVVGCTALQKSPLWWAVHHRLHHRHSDTASDPHSPVVNAFPYSHMGWLFVNDLMFPDMSLVKDLSQYRELGFIGGRAVMLELRKKYGNILAIGSAWLDKAEFDPAVGVALHVGAQIFTLPGRNLNAEARPNVRLFQGIARHRVTWIHEVDEPAAMKTQGQGTLVEEIEW